MNRDFYDDDLVKPREEVKRIKMGPGDDHVESPVVDRAMSAPERPVSDLNMTLMSRHRKRVETESARAMEEIERLRQQQEALEREKRELEDARKRQLDYESGKRELLDGLNQSLVTLERNEIKTQQLAELLQGTRKRFRTMLEEISDIREEVWPEDSIREELGKAITRIDDARMEFNKLMSRIESVLKSAEGDAGGAMLLEPVAPRMGEDKTFAEWFRAGLAFTLPLLILLAILCGMLIWQAV